MNACLLPLLSSHAASCVCVCVCSCVLLLSLVSCLVVSSVVAPPSLGSFLVLVWVNLDGDVALHIQTIRNL